MSSSAPSRPGAIVVFGLACLFGASGCAATSSGASAPPPSDPTPGGSAVVDASPDVRPADPPPPARASEVDGGSALTARLLRQRCRTELQDQVRRRGDGEVSGWRGDGDLRDVDTRLRTLRGELLIRNRAGREAVHDYLCSFRRDRDDELIEVDYSRAGSGTAGEELPLLLRTQCRSSVEALLARREEGRVKSWQGDGLVREIDPQVVRVEGEMILRPPQGRPVVHRYACSFRSDQNYRLVDVEHQPGGTRAGQTDASGTSTVEPG